MLPNVVAAMMATFNWWRLPAWLRPLALLTLFALLTEVVCRALWLLKLNNLFMLPLYISVEFGLLVWLYGRTLASRWLCRLRWPLVIGMGGLACLEGMVQSGQPAVYSHGSRLLESLLVILLSLRYYNVSLRRPSAAYIWNEPMFWVSTGLLFFFAGTFLIYTATGYAFYCHRPVVMQLWLVNAGLSSLLYATYAYALWLSLKS